MFLTAKQAREVNEQSDVIQDKILSDISVEVRRVAEIGKTSLELSTSSRAYLANEFFKIEKKPCYPTELTLKQFAVVKKLQALGYQVKIVQVEIKVLNFDGDYEPSTTEVVRISW